MTAKPIAALVTLGRSWSQAPELVLKGEEFRSEGFDRGERAYRLEARDAEADTALEFAVVASEDSPLVNLPLAIRNWGPLGATLELDGQPVARGKAFRYGHRHQLDGSTLLVWIERESTQPVTVRLQREKPAP
jgi:hypothetical protein